ncbi:MAG: sialate O-acetylesterase [Bacteroidota bacterium]|nr:sialate O-acetylesterase [Bacteroidota bacterium]MDP4234377.1 sialate O-acetylesterase [Bacteroidota bacterium]MDP4243310.1 sialate O-acetylesterase [Bacteroidota bacterium]
MRHKWTLVIGVVLLLGARAAAQVHFISPLARGILQVHGDHADLRLHALIPPSYQHFRIKLSSDKDTSSPFYNQDTVLVQNGSVDTLITVPKSLRNYTLWWFADSAGSPLLGYVPGLTPGHIIGIAGQSNAQGFCWDMFEQADGDIRMLRNDTVWQHAFEPTGNEAGGPWIVMANELYKLIGDTLPIGIVNVAAAGSGIVIPGDGGLWQRNSMNPVDSSHYGSALRRFYAAGGELECLCWIQGENEAYFAPYLQDPATYRAAFQGLMRDLRQDLSDTFQIFHLQVGGVVNLVAPCFPLVHEAQRSLPPSILAGTALGRSVGGDGVHYDVPTLWAVGDMFADAILTERYSQSRPMYPPLMPDSVAYIDSIADGSIPGRYCFSLGWTRRGKSVKLMTAHAAQCFALAKDGQIVDTSKVWFRLSSDSERVLLGLRDEAISLDHQWSITYNATAGADQAPIATIEQVSGDTIFGTAFYNLPVSHAAAPQLSVRDPSMSDPSAFSIVPWQTAGGFVCDILASKSEEITIELRDTRGALISRSLTAAKQGLQQVFIATDGVASGNYWIVLSSTSGKQAIEKVVILH